MDEDKTYCYNTKCKHRSCERHASHIQRHYIPHSFAFFKDCEHWDLPEVYFTTSDGGEQDDLKPCPFCGSVATIINTGNHFPKMIFYRVVCKSSCTMQARLYRTIEESVKAWNMRHETFREEQFNDYEPQAVGVLIKTRLKEVGMTQRELADAAGITEITISRYINGEREPKVSTLYRIAKALKTDLNYFQYAFEIPFSRGGYGYKIDDD